VPLLCNGCCLQAAIRALREGVAAEQARRSAERAAEEAKKVALKAALEEQMKLNATRRWAL
jgi:hypothetical protein